jgi:hypothetical protein
MVGRGDPVIADRFGRLHEFAQGRRFAADIDDRQGHAQSHFHLRLIADPGQSENNMRRASR